MVERREPFTDPSSALGAARDDEGPRVFTLRTVAFNDDDLESNARVRGEQLRLGEGSNGRRRLADEPHQRDREADQRVQLGDAGRLADRQAARAKSIARRRERRVEVADQISGDPAEGRAGLAWRWAGGGGAVAGAGGARGGGGDRGCGSRRVRRRPTMTATSTIATSTPRPSPALCDAHWSIADQGRSRRRCAGGTLVASLRIERWRPR